MCGKQMIYPKMQTPGKSRDVWQTIMEQGKCQAIVFNEMMQRNDPYTQLDFSQSLLNKFNRFACDSS